VISNSTPSSGIDLRAQTHGSGKLTLMHARDTLGANNIAFANGSTWTGNWDFTDGVQERIDFTDLSVPRGVRMGSGAVVYYKTVTTIKGTLSGTGTNLVYQTSTLTIGTTTDQGVVSPGDGGPGNVTLTSYSSSAGNYSPTLAFSGKSVYEVDIRGPSSYDRVTVAGTGTGTGKATIAAGAVLNVTLWTPTDSGTLDATILDTTGGGGGLLTGAFSTINWSNTSGWSGLAVTKVDNDLHVTGRYERVNADANANGMPDAWETRYFGSTANALGAADADWDVDGMSNYGEWVAGTDPTNRLSLLRFGSLVQHAVGAGMVVRWSSESNRFYTLRLSTNLVLDPFTTVLTNRARATPPMNVHTDAVSRASAFYRIAVENQ
jgi:hypothetical protein